MVKPASTASDMKGRGESPSVSSGGGGVAVEALDHPLVSVSV